MNYESQGAFSFTPGELIRENWLASGVAKASLDRKAADERIYGNSFALARSIIIRASEISLSIAEASFVAARGERVLLLGRRQTIIVARHFSLVLASLKLNYHRDQLSSCFPARQRGILMTASFAKQPGSREFT
jgi:hypothetical protein